jgi:S1-C subfamily serine protease
MSLLMLMSEAGFARVTGLPDFTELVEKSGPAVVNIRVTQFGERALGRPDGMDGSQGQQEIPEFFRRFFDVPGAPIAAVRVPVSFLNPTVTSSPIITSSTAPTRSSSGWPIGVSSKQN